MNQTTSDLYQNISPSQYSWIGAGSGVRGVGYNFSAAKTYCRAELYIDRGEKEENEFIFDELLKLKAEIETSFGGQLEWERLDNKRACRIKAEGIGNIYDRDQWESMVKFMVDAMLKLETAIREPLRIIGADLKSPPNR